MGSAIYPRVGNMGVLHFFTDKKALGRILLILSLFFLAGCSGDKSSNTLSDNSGGLRLQLSWPEKEVSEGTSVLAATTDGFDCMSGTIQTISFAVYDSEKNLLVDLEDATFDCSDGKGVVENVPTGENIRLVVLANGYGIGMTTETVYYRGEYPDEITVENGKTTELGTIDMFDYTPELSGPGQSAIIDMDELTFEWEEVTGAASYRILFSRISPTGADPVEYETSDVSFSAPSSEDDFFVINGSYTWSVAAIDGFGNQGNEKTRYFYISY